MSSIADDKSNVIETVYMYAQGIDTRDWGLYRSIFTDEIFVDFSSYHGQPGEKITADEWVARLQPLFSGLAATQHSMTNPIVTFDPKGAECRMYMQAEHVHNLRDPDSWYTIGGFYTDHLVRKGGRWLIDSVTLTIFWRRGDPECMVRAAAQGMAAATEGKWESWSRPVDA